MTSLPWREASWSWNRHCASSSAAFELSLPFTAVASGCASNSSSCPISTRLAPMWNCCLDSPLISNSEWRSPVSKCFATKRCPGCDWTEALSPAWMGSVTGISSPVSEWIQ